MLSGLRSLQAFTNDNGSTLWVPCLNSLGDSERSRQHVEVGQVNDAAKGIWGACYAGAKHLTGPQ